MKTTSTFLKATLALLLIFSVSITAKSSSESSLAAGLHCPYDVWINCNDEIWDLSIYGNAYYVDYSGQHDAGEPTVQYNLSSCNTGTIIRTWSKYIYGILYTCSQTIYVSGEGGFDETNINWPPFEYAVQGCNPPTDPEYLPAPYNYPTYDYVDCSLVARSHSDMLFTISATCKKIIRTWTIIDWCQYVPGYPNSPGKWTYNQLIKIEMAEPPIIECPEDITVWANTCTSGIADLPDLHVYGNACGGDYIITNNSPYADYGGSNASGIYPIGEHTVRYKIEYGCGKKEYCYVDISVEDSKAAVPICYGNIAVALMPVFEDYAAEPIDGMVEVWAKDINKGSYHPCRPDEELTFSFSSDPEDQFVLFSCNEVGENEVEMWVTDERGNQSFCIVTIDVQNNAANIPDCEPIPELTSAILGGQLTDMWDGATSDAMVRITGYAVDTNYVITVDTTISVIQDSFQNAGGYWLYYEISDTSYTETIDTLLVDMSKEMYSTEEGMYQFDELEMYTHYQIQPEKSGKAAEGIGVADIIKVFFHIIGREPFDHPFYFLAADVDQSGVIDIQDIIMMQEVYHGDRTDFPVESNWIFIPKDQEWDDEISPFEIEWQHELHIMSLEDHSMYNDFWAVQLGNVSPIEENPDDGRNTRRRVSNQNDLLVFSDKGYDLFFAQFEGNLDGTQKIQKNEDFLMSENGGQTTVFWLADKDNTATAIEILGKSISDNPKLAVLRTNEWVDLSIHESPFRLTETHPNPFVDEVQLSLESRISGPVQLKLSNTLGELIYQEERWLQKGTNTWNLQLGEVSTNRLILYSVSSKEFQISGKWIRLK